MTWTPRSQRFKQIQRLQATHACAIDARIAVDAARGVTTSRRTRQRLSRICGCPTCRPPTPDECAWTVIPSPEDGVRASLERIHKRNQGECFYCGADISEHGRHRIDRMTPLRLGGAVDPRNLVAACHRCEASKRTKTSEEYRVFLTETRGLPPIFHGERGATPRCPRYPHDGEFAFRAAGRRGTHARFPCEGRADLVTIPGWTDATADEKGSTIATAFTPRFLAGKTVQCPVSTCEAASIAVAVPPRAEVTTALRRRKRRALDVLRAR